MILETERLTLFMQGVKNKKAFLVSVIIMSYENHETIPASNFLK